MIGMDMGGECLVWTYNWNLFVR